MTSLATTTPSTATPASLALSAEGIAHDFSGVRALDGVDVAVAAGEIVGLIGPNGSGKSTLLNVISGLVHPTNGRVTLDGAEITGWRADRIARAGVARTFQNIRLFGTLTARENVEVALAFGSAGGHRARSAATELLADFDLLGAADRSAAELPYGLQRRLEIARALATDARYLLLDEPAAGMNEAESDDLLATLAEIGRARGVGLLVIDHDLRLIMRLCSRVAVLSEGRMIANDVPDAIARNTAVIEAYLGSPLEPHDGGNR